jgi:hypothetical protein
MKSLLQESIATLKELRNCLLDIPIKLSALRDAVDEQTKTIHETRKANDDANHPTPVIRADLQVPHPIEVQTDPKDKHTGRENLKFVISTLTLLFVAGYTVITWFIFCESKNATNIAHHTLVMSERSWVGQSGPITLKFFNSADHQLAANIHLTLENFGHSPAVFVFHAVELVPHNDLANAADRTCKSAAAIAGIKVPGMVVGKSSLSLTGQVIFPQQTREHVDEDGPINSKNEVLYAVGCIIYRDDVTDSIWRTRFCQETRWLASSYRDGDPLVSCNVYNETGKY